VIPELRDSFNRRYQPAAYTALLAELEARCGLKVEFRVAETPIFVPLALLDQMAHIGMELAQSLRRAAPFHPGTAFPARRRTQISLPPISRSSATPPAAWFRAWSSCRPFPLSTPTRPSFAPRIETLMSSTPLCAFSSVD
jgi:hypothetical protein